MLQVTSHYILSIHMLNVEPVPSEFTGLHLTFFLRRGNDSGFSPYQSYRDCVWSWRPLLRLLKNVTLKMSNFSVESSLYVF